MQTKLVVEGTPEELARIARLIGGTFPVEGIAAHTEGEQLELPFPEPKSPKEEALDLTLDDVKALLKKVTAEVNLDTAKVIMLKYAPSPSAIKPADYTKIAAECEKALRVAH